MTQSKNTKRALLASVLSLILCISMLIGNTLAWFTDTATTGVKTIVSGKLDVELYYSSNMTDWQDAENTADDAIFGANDLWEPGFTKVVYFKVKNAGNLALKYSIGTYLIENIIGKTANGDDIDLTKFIKFAIVPTDTVLDGRDAVRSEADDCHIFGAFSEELQLLPGAEATFAFVAYMPEDVGEEAIYEADNAPIIKFGIVVVAAQDSVEYDSFGNQYDADARYPMTVNINSTTTLEVHQYVSGKDLVLVYTKDENVSFKYADSVMYDLSTKYTKDGYSKTYALVVDTIESGTIYNYKGKITSVNGTVAADSIYNAPAVACDVNGDGKLTARDQSVIFGVINGYENYFKDYMMNVFFADLNNDKTVNETDVSIFQEARGE